MGTEPDWQGFFCLLLTSVAQTFSLKETKARPLNPITLRVTEYETLDTGTHMEFRLCELRLTQLYCSTLKYSSLLFQGVLLLWALRLSNLALVIQFSESR